MLIADSSLACPKYHGEFAFTMSGYHTGVSQEVGGKDRNALAQQNGGIRHRTSSQRRVREGSAILGTYFGDLLRALAFHDSL